GTPNESPQGPVVFYIDDGNPTVTLAQPNSAFKNSLPSLIGNVSDDADGLTLASKTIYFRLKQNSSGNYWVQTSSSYIASAADCLMTIDNTCLAGVSGGGNIYTVTHSSFTPAGGAFVDGQAYTAYLISQDR